ncbi:MAG: hypothetical protein AAF614_31395 [Chloroflexota bacterium]
MTQIGVDCSFTPNGNIRVKRVQLNGRWQMVEQGRQWVDGNGRHVLVMLPGQQAREIILRPDTLVWEMKPSRNNSIVV